MSYYFLKDKKNLTKEQIGGKGYYLHQMAQLNLPIPAASFLSTDLWQDYRKNPAKTTKLLKSKIIPEIIEYFKSENNGVMPLVSVRSAGAVSMPGMMDTVLNVGISEEYIKETGDKKNQSFMIDLYRRFLTMYGETVLGIKKDSFEDLPKFKSVKEVKEFFEKTYKKSKKDLPSSNIEDQLLDCILAVFNSWDNERAKLYRKINKINDNAGTAVVIQQMVFGNKNDLSATGVLFSRNPSNGKATLSGEYLINAQGEDVVSGSTTPFPIEELKEEMPELYQELYDIAQRLEHHYKQVQDIEFTIEDGKLFILQARTAKCAPFAKLKMLMDMYKSQEISAKEVIDALTLREYLDLNVKQVDGSVSRSPQGQGLPASIGAMSGRVVFGPSTKYKGEPTILLAKETTPDDLEAIQLATGILTASGGATSHAAVVARGMGKVCIVGCADLKIKKNNGETTATIGGVPVKSGDWITLDANDGRVWVGKDIPIIDAQNSQIFWDLEDLVIEANPNWIRVTSSVDELIKGKQSYFLTYALDGKDNDFISQELGDAVNYLTGVMDLTGKLDYLQEKYQGQFLFTDFSAEKTFLAKKRVLTKLALTSEIDFDSFSLFLGPYEEEYGQDLKEIGYKIEPSKNIAFNKPNKEAKIVITQSLDDKIMNDSKISVGISSKNALLGALR